jgi:hypothetical protein
MTRLGFSQIDGLLMNNAGLALASRAKARLPRHRLTYRLIASVFPGCGNSPRWAWIPKLTGLEYLPKSGEGQDMLLPIVLLLATAGSMQPANSAAAKSEFSTNRPQTVITDPGPNSFLRGRPGAENRFDKGIILPNHSCVAQEGCRTGCLSITAYVFSDGENPTLKYVTDCPNLDVPLQNKRAQGKGMGSDHQPALKRTNLEFNSPKAK